MRLPCFDVILGLAAGAIDVLIDGAAGDAVEAGDDEAGVDAERSGLDACDKPRKLARSCAGSRNSTIARRVGTASSGLAAALPPFSVPTMRALSPKAALSLV